MPGSASTPLRNDILDEAGNQLDRLELLDAAVVIATFTITWSAAASGSKSASGLPSSVNTVAAGTIDGARLYKNADGTREITSLSVGTTGSGNQVEVDDLTVGSGQQITLTSCVLTFPAATT